jgi:hypothetical protein
MLVFVFAAFAPLGTSYADQFKPADVCNQVKPNTPDGEIPSYCQTINNADDPITGSDGVLANIVDLVSFVAGAAAVILVVIGGFRFVLSNGEPEKAASARKTILYSLVGLAIVLLAQTIVSFVISKI